MSKIIRTPVRAEGAITPEEKKKMDLIFEKWKLNAFQTGHIDKEKITDAIKRLYKSANLDIPRIVIVPSPFIGRLASGIASAIWYLRKNKNLAATYAATDAATYAATYAATRAATEKNCLHSLVKIFTPNEVKFTLGCISLSWKLYQGGNMWSYFCSYAEAMRDVIGLTGLDCWKKYQVWEDCAKYGGFRYMHEKFCIVSDFPEKLTIDEQNRPHNEHGASHRWRDGFEIYYLHGVRFPKDLYMKVISREMEMSEIMNIKDIDQRVQAMKFAKNGLREWYLSEGGRKIDEIDKKDVKGKNIHYELWKIPSGKTFNKEVHFMIYDCPSAKERREKREYSKGVPEFKTCAEAMSWGMSDDKYAMRYSDWEKMIPLVHES